MPEEFEAKVAKLLTPTRVALNAGRDRGVSSGDEVTMFRTEVILDPDSGEELDRVKLVKLELMVDEVRDKICVARVTSINRPRGANLWTVKIFNTSIQTMGERAGDDVDAVVSIGETVRIRHSDPPESPGA